ncbi:MAG: hypothetical protein DRP63_02635 [Planctomycetota bacterium]|nr:MAG: hypothetical protein DRP63_02635 [Planctomycetota bacterium]
MKKLGVAGLFVCFIVAFASAEEKQKGTAPEPDVWKQLNVKVGALIKLTAIFEDPHGQSDNNHYFKVDHVFINIKGSFAKDFKFFIQPHYSHALPGGAAVFHKSPKYEQYKYEKVSGAVDGANMFVDYVRFPVKIRFGKFMYPGSLGAFTPASKMDFATRPMMSAETALPQCRDIGLMLFGDALKGVVANRDLRVRVYGSVTNGKRPREQALGEGMMYTLRAELRFGKLFSFGVCYLKNHQDHTHWMGCIPTKMGTFYDLSYSSVDATVSLGRIRVGGEFLQGWCVEEDDSDHDFSGFYAKMFFRFCKYAEIGARYEVWDRDLDDDYKTGVLTVGLNVLLNPKNPNVAKIQVNWRNVDEDNPRLVRKEGNTLQVLLQICF